MPDRQMLRLSDAALFALLAGLGGFAIAAFAPQIFNDGDTYWHIRAGQWMLAHHAVIRRDIFSYTMAGKPWPAQEWLSEILMALAWKAGGWRALHILFGFAAGATAAILGYALRDRLSPLAAFVALVFGACAIVPSLLARPHLLALPVLAGWCLGLVRARETDLAPSPWLLLLMPLWANLHGSFMFGIALAGALALEAAFETPPEQRLQTIRGWALFVAAALLAALATPHGVAGILFPFRLLGMTGLSYVSEWKSADFSTLQPFELAILAAVFVIATRGVRLTALRALILLSLVHMSLQHVRHVLLLGTAGTLLLATPLAGVFAGEPRRSRANSLGAVAVAAVLALLIGLRLALPVVRGDDAASPVTALAQVPAALRQAPVLNDYTLSGYLMFRGIRTFIDGRVELYNGPFFANDMAIQQGNRAALIATLARYHIRWTIMAAGEPANGLLAGLPGWHRLYADRYAVIYACGYCAPG